MFVTKKEGTYTELRLSHPLWQQLTYNSKITKSLVNFNLRKTNDYFKINSSTFSIYYHWSTKL